MENKDILQDLTEDQKLSLLTRGNLFSDHEGSLDFDIGLKAEHWESISKAATGGVTYPPLHSLVNSWNTSLIERVSQEIANFAKQEGKTALITPSLAVKTHPYAEGAVEDVLLASNIASSCAQGISKGGCTPILSEGGLASQDVRFLDTLPNKRAIKNLLKPLDTALKESGRGAILVSHGRLEGEYATENLNILGRINHKKFFSPVDEQGNTDIEFASLGLKAPNTSLLNRNPLQSMEAYTDFLNFKECLQNGDISTQTLDRDTDRFLEFAFECSKFAQANPPREDLANGAGKTAVSAAEQSIVLLKNISKTLPIKQGERVAVVGQLAALSNAGSPSFVDTLQKRKQSLPFDFVGFADGYELHGKSGDLTAEAVKLAQGADTVLVFLGFFKDDRMLKLPSNQLALLEMLAETGKKIVGIVFSAHGLDASMDKNLGALLLLPPFGTYVSNSLLKILCGYVNPSGRLAYTIYDHTDQRFAAQNTQKEAGKIRIGEFTGYRRYDSAGEAVKYPFGHGLGYTAFEYKNIKANALGVQFQLKNTGKQEGCELVQVYIGRKNSLILSPKKELRHFQRVQLEAGKSTLVKIKFSKADFTHFYDENGKAQVEGGEYIVYVGSSVSDVRLQASFKLKGEKCKRQIESLSDYIHEQSNIISGGYTMKNANEKRENEIVLQKKLPLEKLFIDEFAEPVKKRKIEEPANEGELVQLDTSLTMKTVSEELLLFLNERGINIKPSSVRDILAAMAASRIVVLRGEDCAELASQISAYFGTPVFQGVLNGQTSAGKLFAERDQGSYRETVTAKALIAAAAARQRIHLLSLKIEESYSEEVLTPFINYASAPTRDHRILLKNQETADKMYTIAPNVWLFLLDTKDGSDKRQYPADSAIVQVGFRKKSEVAQKTELRQIGCPQFLRLVYNAEEEFFVSEKMWKKLDKVEEFANTFAPYNIGNKQWRKMEKFASVCLCCGATEAEAIDSVIAAKLLYSLLSHIKTKSKLNEVLLMLEKTLGEQTSACQEAARHFAG